MRDAKNLAALRKALLALPKGTSQDAAPAPARSSEAHPQRNRCDNSDGQAPPLSCFPLTITAANPEYRHYPKVQDNNPETGTLADHYARCDASELSAGIPDVHL